LALRGKAAYPPSSCSRARGIGSDGYMPTAMLHVATNTTARFTRAAIDGDT
jgi:hypothetical protein